MQTVKYDVTKVMTLLQNKHKIMEYRFYKGDYSACDLLIDLDTILALCKLTDKQMMVVEKHLIEGYTQEEVANMLGVTQQMVEKHSKTIKKKIDKILRGWDYVN